MATTLPLELTAEVLCRLPGKSVARFCSVSKDWASFFSSPYFSRLHCHRRQQNLGLIVRDGSLYSLDLGSLDCALRVDYFLQDSNFTVKKVLGLSNGLVCLSVSSSDTNPNPNPFFRTPEFNDDIIVICNLSTGARRIVPPASVDFRPQGLKMFTPYEMNRRFSYGFAFDPSGNDYKLIRISQYVFRLSTPTSYPHMLSQIKVYSMKTNSWTRLDQDLSPFCISFLKDPVLVDGASHWVAGVLDHRNWHYDRPTSIVAFNLADATFREVPHLTNELDLLKLNLGEGVGGPHLEKFHILKLSLGAVGGRLCVVCLHLSLCWKIVIWKLGGNGDARSWEPLATFACGSDEEEQVLWMEFWASKPWVFSKSVFSNNGDKVLVDQQEDNKLICCDLTEETMGLSQIKFITMQPSKKEK